MIYKFFDQESADSGVNTHANKCAFNNKKLAKELHKPNIKKLEKEWFIQELKIIFGVLI